MSTCLDSESNKDDQTDLLVYHGFQERHQMMDSEGPEGGDA